MKIDDYAESSRYLKKLFKNDRNVYTCIRKVSSSGMTRHIKVFIARKNQIIDITWHVGNVTKDRINRDTWALVVSGCGMDMGFDLIYRLSRILYPKGFKLPKDQPWGRNGDTSGYDKDGGYRLKQSWI